MYLLFHGTAEEREGKVRREDEEWGRYLYLTGGQMTVKANAPQQYAE